MHFHFVSAGSSSQSSPSLTTFGPKLRPVDYQRPALTAWSWSVRPSMHLLDAFLAPCVIEPLTSVSMRCGLSLIPPSSLTSSSTSGVMREDFEAKTAWEKALLLLLHLFCLHRMAGIKHHGLDLQEICCLLLCHAPFPSAVVSPRRYSLTSRSSILEQIPFIFIMIFSPCSHQISMILL